MAEQLGEKRSESQVAEELQMDDLASCQSSLMDPSTPGGAEARLARQETRRTDMGRSQVGLPEDRRYEDGPCDGRRPDQIVEPPLHFVNASSSGEVEFRMPSRQAGRDTEESFEVEGPVAGDLMRGKRRALEQHQVINPARQAMTRPHSTPPIIAQGRYNDLVGRGIDYDQGVGRIHGLPADNYQITGEPIRVREVREPEGRNWRENQRGWLYPSNQTPANVMSEQGTCTLREVQEKI